MVMLWTLTSVGHDAAAVIVLDRVGIYCHRRMWAPCHAVFEGQGDLRCVGCPSVRPRRPPSPCGIPRAGKKQIRVCQLGLAENITGDHMIRAKEGSRPSDVHVETLVAIDQENRTASMGKGRRVVRTISQPDRHLRRREAPRRRLLKRQVSVTRFAPERHRWFRSRSQTEAWMPAEVTSFIWHVLPGNATRIPTEYVAPMVSYSW